MTDNLGTELDQLAPPTPETREAARRVVETSGRGDVAELLLILGLADHDPNVINGHRICPGCKKPLPSTGKGACRRVGCTTSGRKARAKGGVTIK